MSALVVDNNPDQKSLNNNIVKNIKDYLGIYDSEIEQVMDITRMDKKLVEEVVFANNGDVQKSILCLMEEEQKPLPKTNLKVSKKTNYQEDLEHDLNLALSEREDFENRLQRINQEVQKLSFDGDKDTFLIQWNAFREWVKIVADPTQTLMRVSRKSPAKKSEKKSVCNGNAQSPT